MKSIGDTLKNFLAYRTVIVNPDFGNMETFVRSVPNLFHTGKGEVIYKDRNELRKMTCHGEEVIVKSFHTPNLINSFIYDNFRPSKAKRSYEYAITLNSIGVSTPDPVGYVNMHVGFLFYKSFYVARASTCPYVYKDLFYKQFHLARDVSRAVGSVTAILHEHGLAHKDYGRGNILFDVIDNQVRIEIIDLNRMYEGPVDIRRGCKNFERLPATPQMHRCMAEAYAAARGFDVDECYALMRTYREAWDDKINGIY
ncbi:MAG: lipopolysaccharide kinase InaA family protein [Prevotellaceae bacterium]|nr:lipopolysaccharide kinase InaA family protein [Prevotellaceae bacterium]